MIESSHFEGNHCSGKGSLRQTTNKTLALSYSCAVLLGLECSQSDASMFEPQEGQAYSIYHIQTDTNIAKSYTESNKAFHLKVSNSGRNTVKMVKNIEPQDQQ